MNWASATSVPLPTFKQIAIHKNDIQDTQAFFNLIALFRLEIEYEEPNYYILNGSDTDLNTFVEFWRS